MARQTSFFWRCYKREKALPSRERIDDLLTEAISSGGPQSNDSCRLESHPDERPAAGPGTAKKMSLAIVRWLRVEQDLTEHFATIALDKMHPAEQFPGCLRSGLLIAWHDFRRWACRGSLSGDICESSVITRCPRIIEVTSYSIESPEPHWKLSRSCMEPATWKRRCGILVNKSGSVAATPSLAVSKAQFTQVSRVSNKPCSTSK